MNIKVLSDLHLEFEKPGSQFDPGTGDVLILAGDICTAIDLVEDAFDLKKVFTDFFDKCSKGFNKVFYVMGNHEHYHGTLKETADILRANVPSNFTVLDNNSEYYNGVHFVGATMWADWCGRDEHMIGLGADRMNDYQVIDYERVGQVLHPTDTLREHDNTLEWFQQVLPTLRGKVVVITHHAPSFRSISEDYVTHETIGAYASNVEELICSHSPVLWVHGHIHDTRNYMIDNTRILCNPKGYPRKDDSNGNFDINHEVTI